jgi:hypothetical protein
MTDLDELERLEKAATPGPWSDIGSSVGSYDPASVLKFVTRMVNHDPESGVITEDDVRSWYKGAALVGESMETRDAALIAAARNALPDIIAELRARRGEQAAIWSTPKDADEWRRLRELEAAVLAESWLDANVSSNDDAAYAKARERTDAAIAACHAAKAGE